MRTLRHSCLTLSSTEMRFDDKRKNLLDDFKASQKALVNS